MRYITSITIFYMFVVVGCQPRMELNDKGTGLAKQSISGTSRLYRLTKGQIINSINQVFGSNIDTKVLGRSPTADGYRNNADFSFADKNELEQLIKITAEALPISSSEDLASFIGCSSVTNLDCTQESCACLQKYFSKTMSWLYRRDVSLNEVQRVVDINTKATTKFNQSDVEAFKMTMTGLLISPEFLFRYEIGVRQPDGSLILTAEEVLSRAAYTLTDNLPALEDIERADELVSSERKFVAYARGLIDSENGKSVLKKFLSQWFAIEDIDSLEKNHEFFPKFTPKLASAMNEEVSTFLDNALAQPKLTLSYLLGSVRTTVDKSLADFYGVPASLETEMGEHRKGLLTLAGVLASKSGTDTTIPTERGSFILSSLFCLPVLGTPADLDLSTIESDGPQTTRQRFEQIAQRGSPCAECHEILDPIGFAFESFDADGSYRTEEMGIPIDTSSVMTGLPASGELRFSNAIDLVEQIPDAPEVQACAVKQVFRYTNGRLESDKDAKTLDRALQAYRDSDWDIRSLFTFFMVDDSYRLRKAE